LQPNSVGTDNIKNGAVVDQKVGPRSVPLNKLRPNLGSLADPGDYVMWNGLDFILVAGSPGGGGGGSVNISAGPGLISTPNPITSVGAISVNLGESGSAVSAERKIPFFNNNNDGDNMDNIDIHPK
jgi:hypothetical protein